MSVVITVTLQYYQNLLNYNLWYHLENNTNQTTIKQRSDNSMLVNLECWHGDKNDDNNNKDPQF